MPIPMSFTTTGTTTIIVLLMLVMLGVFLRGRSAANRSAWASYLVSLGIFGTFLGISVALLSFDARAVEQSVPDLLAGMKVAFISSSWGIFLALVLRWRSLQITEAGAAEGKNADDIFAVMQGHTALLESLKNALVGDGDTTLITQLRLLRQESKDNAARISDRLEHFAETLAARGESPVS